VVFNRTSISPSPERSASDTRVVISEVAIVASANNGRNAVTILVLIISLQNVEARHEERRQPLGVAYADSFCCLVSRDSSFPFPEPRSSPEKTHIPVFQDSRVSAFFCRA